MEKIFMAMALCLSIMASDFNPTSCNQGKIGNNIRNQLEDNGGLPEQDEWFIGQNDPNEVVHIDDNWLSIPHNLQKLDKTIFLMGNAELTVMPTPGYGKVTFKKSINVTNNSKFQLYFADTHFDEGSWNTIDTGRIIFVESKISANVNREPAWSVAMLCGSGESVVYKNHFNVQYDQEICGPDRRRPQTYFFPFVRDTHKLYLEIDPYSPSMRTSYEMTVADQGIVSIKNLYLPPGEESYGLNSMTLFKVDAEVVNIEDDGQLIGSNEISKKSFSQSDSHDSPISLKLIDSSGEGPLFYASSSQGNWGYWSYNSASFKFRNADMMLFLTAKHEDPGQFSYLIGFDSYNNTNSSSPANWTYPFMRTRFYDSPLKGLISAGLGDIEFGGNEEGTVVNATTVYNHSNLFYMNGNRIDHFNSEAGYSYISDTWITGTGGHEGWARNGSVVEFFDSGEGKYPMYLAHSWIGEEGSQTKLSFVNIGYNFNIPDGNHFTAKEDSLISFQNVAWPQNSKNYTGFACTGESEPVWHTCKIADDSHAALAFASSAWPWRNETNWNSKTIWGHAGVKTKENGFYQFDRYEVSLIKDGVYLSTKTSFEQKGMPTSDRCNEPNYEMLASFDELSLVSGEKYSIEIKVYNRTNQVVAKSLVENVTYKE